MKIEIGATVEFTNSSAVIFSGTVMDIDRSSHIEPQLFVGVLGYNRLFQVAESRVKCMHLPPPKPARLEQLRQLCSPTWDGNLISKDARDALVSADLAFREAGWNVISPKGLRYLIELGVLRA